MYLDDLKESYQYYSDDDLESSYIDANRTEKKRITDELNRRHEKTLNDETMKELTGLTDDEYNRMIETGKRHWIWTNNRLKSLPFECRHKLIEMAKEDVRICIDNNGINDPICQSMAEEMQDMEVYLG